MAASVCSCAWAARDAKPCGGGSSNSGQAGCRRLVPGRRGCAAQATSRSQGAVDPPVQPHELIRVLAVTDLHADYDDNMRWCEAIDDEAYRRDVLIVSGDVSDELATLEAALGTLAAKVGALFYCPGNHELWVRERDRAVGVFDSLTKLHRIAELCARLGIHTQPQLLGGRLWVAPLLSWHHRSWDTEPDVPGVPPPSSFTVSDYSACKWPHSVPGGASAGSLELAQWFDGMNDTPAWHSMLAGRQGCDVISFSHFLPHQALLPEKRYLYYPNLTKAVGSVPLAARLQQLSPDIHLFGHTHFAWDTRLGGTRYIQAPLCSPAERHRRIFTVGFGASMEQAKADPVGAPWLPQVVYQGLLPAGSVEALQAGGAADAAAAAAAGHPGVVLPGGAGGADGSGSAHGRRLSSRSRSGGSAGQAGRGALADQAVAQQQQQQQQVPPGDHPQQHVQPPVPQLPLLHAHLASQGWRPLRHGAEAPPLRAHWSDYYETHDRQPDCVTLAPWVESRWQRRRARVAARAGAGTGSEGSGSEQEDTD